MSRVARLLLEFGAVLRFSLAIACVFLGALAQCAALTLDDISLMLRSGCSSEAIMDDLTRGTFDNTLDPQWEQEFIRLRASPALIETLKSGKDAPSKASALINAIKSGNYAPSEEEKLRRQEFVNRQGDVATNPLISEAKQVQQAANAQAAAKQAAAQQAAVAQAVAEWALAEQAVAKQAAAEQIVAEKSAAVAATRASLEEIRLATEKAQREEQKVDAEERRQVARAQDRRQAQEVIDKLQLDLFTGHSREQMKTDLFMATGQGPKAREVIDQMQTNLFMRHSKEQLKTDLFMMNP